MRIIEYDEKYRDDMIFMILEAKDAIGKIPNITDDLCSIENSYLKNGGMFWLALDESDRVIGSCGYLLIDESEARLKRFYVKASLKRNGIGSVILDFAEQYLRTVGKKKISVHLGEKKYYFESYEFYKKHGYIHSEDRYMYKCL